MLDNRGEWAEFNVSRETDLPLVDRLLDGLSAFLGTASDMVRMLTYRSDLYRSRQHLRDLNEEQLRDIGLTRRQAETEAERPFFEG